MKVHIERNPTSAAGAASTNGSGAAAIVATGLGAFALGVLTVAGDKSDAMKRLFTFYRPTGPLSGVTTAAIGFWLGAWVLLARRWKGTDLHLDAAVWTAFVLLVLGLLLTFPPVGHLF
jgi:hypothetical protein